MKKIRCSSKGIMELMGVIVATVFVLSSGCGDTGPSGTSIPSVQMGPPVGSDKKVIGWASDRVDEIYLSEHYEEMERDRPIDGVVICLFPDEYDGGKSPDGPRDRNHRNRSWFGESKYSVADFKEGIARLKSCKFMRFTDNFFDFPTTIWGERQADWFDDNWDEVVLNNIVVAAKIAKEVGFKGLFIDTESYRYGVGVWWDPFSYHTYIQECAKDGQEPRSLQECKAQVRERGRAVGQAVTEVYPDIVLFFIFGIGLNADHQELLIPFVDGILETAGPQVTVHDGGERGYPQMLYSSFKKLREDADRTGRGHSAIPDVFEHRIRHGFGIWVDPNTSSYGGFHTDDLSKNHKDGPEFEHTLYNALTVSDKYVWLYVWHPILWWTPNLEQHTMCQLCPHKELPKPYLKAIVNCRKPHDLRWTPPKKDNP